MFIWFSSELIKSYRKKTKEFSQLANFHRPKPGISQGSTSWGRKVSHPLVVVIICNAHYVSSMWHHLCPILIASLLVHGMGRKLFTNHPSRRKLSAFSKIHLWALIGLTSLKLILARIVWVKGWGAERFWQSDESEVGFTWPFCFHKHERYGSLIIPTLSFGLVAFCVLKTLTSGLSSDRCPCGEIKHS